MHLPSGARAAPASDLPQVCLAVDIGGTFTDVVLAIRGERFTAKILTDSINPERAFMAGVVEVLVSAGLRSAQVNLLIHGTTLATNALIERKGAKVALLCTEGFRDSLEMGYEHRFEQSDLFMVRPAPLVPRSLRFPIRERIAADGSIAIPLDEQSIERLIPALQSAAIEAIAIGFMHSYANPEHERRTAQVLARHLPSTPISVSSDISPEIREYDRISTTTANAYIQPLMAGYLQRLQHALHSGGFSCPLLVMMSSGGMATLEVARRYPIRLVESGPAGGAMLARRIAAECGLPRVVSFDMGGTTAKLCLIDDYQPDLSRTLEVARQHRFLKGSGIPLRIPVVNMAEIGAGGGSIAEVDPQRRIAVGPESAGSSPGPACYGNGGALPTVTDADLVLGRIDADRFAGGRIKLHAHSARAALTRSVADRLGLSCDEAAYAVSEIVDESMANAARIHSLECGKTLDERTLIAFGGAAPLHACCVAEKLGIRNIVIPSGAGVGSAIGFLCADMAYEVVRSHYMQLRHFNPSTVTALFSAMYSEAEAIVRLGAGNVPLVETRTVSMRYRGQGHEVVVPLPNREFDIRDEQLLIDGFEREYLNLYGRIIRNLTLEAMSFSLRLSTDRPLPARAPEVKFALSAVKMDTRTVFDPETQAPVDTPIYRRADLPIGARVPGPALIVEDETSTYATGAFVVDVNALGHLVLTRLAVS